MTQLPQAASAVEERYAEHAHIWSYGGDGGGSAGGSGIVGGRGGTAGGGGDGDSNGEYGGRGSSGGEGGARGAPHVPLLAMQTPPLHTPLSLVLCRQVVPLGSQFCEADEKPKLRGVSRDRSAY